MESQATSLQVVAILFKIYAVNVILYNVYYNIIIVPIFKRTLYCYRFKLIFV